MADNKREWATEEVLGEERCATCKYWFGRWRGGIDSRNIKEWNDHVPNDTFSTGTDDSQFTYGECRRFPPTQSSIEKVRSHQAQIRWSRWLGVLEASYEKADRRLHEAEEEMREAVKVAIEHPEQWDRQMAEAKVAKLAKEIKKLERQQEESEWRSNKEQLASLERMAPEKSVRTGVWPKTTSYGWCGEYRRDKEKTDLLIEDLCGDRDSGF